MACHSLSFAAGHPLLLPQTSQLPPASQMEYPIGDEEGAGAEEDEEEDFLVGPPPPEVAEELDAGE